MLIQDVLYHRSLIFIIVLWGQRPYVGHSHVHGGLHQSLFADQQYDKILDSKVYMGIRQ